MIHRRRASPRHAAAAAAASGWCTALAVAVALVGTAAVSGAMRAPAARAGDALQGPTAYLLHAQNADGGFGADAGPPSSPLFSGWAALGLQAAGVRLQAVDRGPGVLAYIERAAGASDAGSVERNILVARAAGLSANDFGGHDLVAMLRGKLERDGSVGGDVNLTAFGILALRAAGVPVPARTDAWLLAQQDHDGGFGFARRGGASDVDDTGAVLEALASLSGSRVGAARARAIAYVRRQQDNDGGFPSQPGEGSNTQSTAWAVQGLDAAGVNPAGVRRAGARSPLAYLQSLIGHDGAVAYARGQDQTPVWVTGEALMALAGKPLPLTPLPAPAPSPARRPKSSAPVTQATTSTSSSESTTSATANPSAKAPAGDSPSESAVVGAVVETAARTLAALRALM